MIIDCFPFLNELDLLELRLNELSTLVDKFVICEGTRTFSNKPKELVFPKNRDRFDGFSDRIEYVVLEDYSGIDVQRSWDMEKAQKQLAIDVATKDIQVGDLLIFSDCDEIPRAEAIQANIGSEFTLAMLEMPLFYYYLNCRCISQIWRRCKLLRVPNNEKIYYTHVHCFSGDYRITNAGWHFSYLGDIEYKINSSTHTEFAKPPYNTPEYIEECVRECRDLFNRESFFHIEDDLSYLPKYVLENRDKFRQHILEQ